jgi:catechol 2,3-dioxygenase-like lactoylglutathione lyase family enzyme
MSSRHRIAPIFAIRDLDRALDRYRRLGFEVRAYEGGGYGFATREDVEIHLGVVDDHEPHTPPRSPAHRVLRPFQEGIGQRAGSGCNGGPSMAQ